MNKFLAKLEVMIVLIVITVTMAGLTIGLLARPLSANWVHGGVYVTYEGAKKTETEVTFKIGRKIAKITYKEKDLNGNDVWNTSDYYVYKEKSKYAIFCMPTYVPGCDEEFESFKAKYNNLTKEEKNEFWSGTLADDHELANSYWTFGDGTNAYKVKTVCGPGEFRGVCKGAVVYTACMILFTLTFGFIAGCSILYYIRENETSGGSSNKLDGAEKEKVKKAKEPKPKKVKEPKKVKKEKPEKQVKKAGVKDEVKKK